MKSINDKEWFLGDKDIATSAVGITIASTECVFFAKGFRFLCHQSVSLPPPPLHHLITRWTRTNQQA